MISKPVEAPETESEDGEEEGKYGPYEDYEIENAADTILRAEEIKKDAKKMEYVKQCLEDKRDAVTNAIGPVKTMKDLKARANQA